MSKGYELCNEFATDIRRIVLEKCLKEVKTYDTQIAKKLVVQDFNNDYIEMLKLIQKVQHILDRVMEEK